MQITIDGIQLSAIVGGKEYLRLPGLWLESARHMPVTRAGLTLPDPAGEEIRRLTVGQQVTFVMGYRGGEASLWQGEITWKKPGTEHQVELGLVGADAVLAKARLTQSFMHESPEAILRHALSSHGIALGRIDSTGLTLPRFATSNENIWQIAEKLELTAKRAFGLDISKWALWMDNNGKAHWGDFSDPGQTNIPGAVSGGNIINHSPATDAGAFSTVETFLLPSLRHSQLFKLQDIYRGTCATYRAQKVRHQADGGSARTIIFYGPEREKY